MTVPAPVAAVRPDSSKVCLPPRVGPHGRRYGRQGRRDAARAAREAAARAELHCIRSVLIDARSHLAQGWVQHAWFAGRPAGRPVPIKHESVRAVATPAACLVGAVVLAAGGPDAVRDQLTQRSLDLLWHTLHRPATDPVRWCPGPALRTLQVQDLTGWNVAPERSLDDVLALVDAAIDKTREAVRLARC